MKEFPCARGLVAGDAPSRRGRPRSEREVHSCPETGMTDSQVSPRYVEGQPGGGRRGSRSWTCGASRPVRERVIPVARCLTTDADRPTDGTAQLVNPGNTFHALPGLPLPPPPSLPLAWPSVPPVSRSAARTERNAHTMNRLHPGGAPWPRHKVKARRQRRRRESHGRTQYRDFPLSMNTIALHRRQQLDPKDYTQ